MDVRSLDDLLRVERGGIVRTSSLQLDGWCNLPHALEIEGDLVAPAGLTGSPRVAVSGDLRCEGDLTVAGALRVGGSLSVTGDLEVLGPLSVSAGVTVGRRARVRDLVAGGSLDVGGALAAHGSVRAASVSVGAGATVAGALSAEGPVRVAGNLRVGEQLTAGAAVEVGSELRAGRGIAAGGDIRARGPIRAEGAVVTVGSIVTGAWLHSSSHEVSCASFQVGQLPPWRSFFAGMAVVEPWADRILDPARCWDEILPMFSDDDRRAVVAWPGWHWIMRGHLEQRFGLAAETIPPAWTRGQDR